MPWRFFLCLGGYMDKFKIQKFVPIAKVDEEEHMVYGWASTSDMDSDGEIIKAEALAGSLSEYMKFPTLREMHQPKAVGTTKQAEVSAKGLYIGAKVVTEEAWKLVKEGVYKAFSIGGNVLKRVGNSIEQLELVEISLVDVPANKAAVIELWKQAKIEKDASGIMRLTVLLDDISWLCDVYSYLGKDSGSLKRMIEDVKRLVVIEAQEAEKEEEHEGEVMMYGKNLFNPTTKAEIESRISALEKMNFGNNLLADSLRRGVIIAMNKDKSKELEKVQDAVKTVETPTTDAPETTEVPVAEVTPETPVVPEEKGEVDATLTKLNAAQALLETVTPKKEVVKSDSLEKSMAVVADVMEKMASTVLALAERVNVLEKTPAQSKSKTHIAVKTIAGEEKETPTEEVITDPVMKAAKVEYDVAIKRLAELDAKFNEIGAAQFAKQQFSMEAGKLKQKVFELKTTYGFN